MVAEEEQQEQEQEEQAGRAADCGECTSCRSMKKFGGDKVRRREPCERRKLTDLQLLAKKRKLERANQRYAERDRKKPWRAHPKRFGMKRRKKANGDIDKRLGEKVVNGGTSGGDRQTDRQIDTWLLA